MVPACRPLESAPPAASPVLAMLTPIIADIRAAAGPAATAIDGLLSQLLVLVSTVLNVAAPAAPRVRLRDAVRQWIEYKAAHSWCFETAQNVMNIWKNWVRLLKNPWLDSIAATDIERLFARSKGSRGWLNYQGSYLSTFFDWALRRGLIRVDPSEAWAKMKGDSTRPYREVSRAEERKLCRALRPPEAKYVIVAIATGLRRGTIYAARWAWITEDGMIEVPPGAVKNKKALRIPLSARALKALGPRQPPEARLIVGLPKADNLNYRLRGGALAAGVDPCNLTTHQFRKTWTARMVEAGATREEVQRIQGWSSANVMLNHYYPPVAADRARELVERVSAPARCSPRHARRVGDHRSRRSRGEH